MSDEEIITRAIKTTEEIIAGIRNEDPTSNGRVSLNYILRNIMMVHERADLLATIESKLIATGKYRRDIMPVEATREIWIEHNPNYVMPKSVVGKNALFAVIIAIILAIAGFVAAFFLSA